MCLKQSEPIARTGTGNCHKFEPSPEGILPYVESLLKVREPYLAVAAGLLV
jgi:hypothetical protein